MTEHDSANLLMFSIQYIMYKNGSKIFKLFWNVAINQTN